MSTPVGVGAAPIHMRATYFHLDPEIEDNAGRRVPDELMLVFGQLARLFEYAMLGPPRAGGPDEVVFTDPDDPDDDLRTV